MSVVRLLVLFGSALLAGQPAHSAPVKTRALEWHSSTVVSGLSRLKSQFLDVSIRRDAEIVGAVLQAPDGAFRFTSGTGRPGADQVSFRIQRPAGLRLVGLWHTHGGHGPGREVFSPRDARLVLKTGLPFYLITPAGEMRVLRPHHVRQSGWFNLKERGRRSRAPRGSHPGELLGVPAGSVTRV